MQPLNIYDGTDIADLMSCFTKKKVNNPKFPLFSSEVQRLKETEGGLTAVCEVMEKYNKEENKEHIEQLLRNGVSVEIIADSFKNYSLEEIKEIQASLLQSV